ncbi:TPA: hypothetical protein ACTEL6_001730 [Legionella pneumophila]
MASSTEHNDHQKIRSNGWKQFCILDNQDGDIPEIPNGKYIIVSQDCDIVQRSFEKEKKVEIIQVTEVPKPNKSNTNLKNFRSPHIPFKDNDIDKYFEIDMGQRYFIERKKLAEVSPITGIAFDKKTQKIIIELIKARYERTALPDAFNTRFPLKKIKKLLKNHSQDTYSLFIDVHPEEELNESDEYHIRLIMLVIEREDAHEELLENIVEEINDRINVVEYRVKTLDEMSIGEYLEFKELWLVELSYQGDEAEVHL